MGQTIQQMIDCGDTVEAWCHNPRCNHHSRLDFIALRDRLGPDHGALHDDLVPKLRCSKCGGKKIGLIRHSKASAEASRLIESAYAGSYAKAKGR